MERIYCLVIGYVFGLVLFAEIIARARLGRSARTIGSWERLGAFWCWRAIF